MTIISKTFSGTLEATTISVDNLQINNQIDGYVYSNSYILSDAYIHAAGNIQTDGYLQADGYVYSNSGVYLFPDQSGGWGDIIGRSIYRTTGGTIPSFQQVGATGFYANAFSIGDEIWLEFHIPHDYVMGTPIYFHTHWFADGTNANSVKWQFRWTTAKGYGRGEFNLASPNVDTAETAPGGSTAQYRHFISETAAQSSANFEIDGIIMVHVTRITNGATDNTDTIYMVSCDVHYQSNGSVTKNRNYPFW